MSFDDLTVPTDTPAAPRPPAPPPRPSASSTPAAPRPSVARPAPTPSAGAGGASVLMQDTISVKNPLPQLVQAFQGVYNSTQLRSIKKVLMNPRYGIPIALSLATIALRWYYGRVSRVYSGDDVAQFQTLVNGLSEDARHLLSYKMFVLGKTQPKLFSLTTNEMVKALMMSPVETLVAEFTSLLNYAGESAASVASSITNRVGITEPHAMVEGLAAGRPPTSDDASIFRIGADALRRMLVRASKADDVFALTDLHRSFGAEYEQLTGFNIANVTANVAEPLAELDTFYTGCIGIMSSFFHTDRPMLSDLHILLYTLSGWWLAFQLVLGLRRSSARFGRNKKKTSKRKSKFGGKKRKSVSKNRRSKRRSSSFGRRKKPASRGHKKTRQSRRA